MRAIGNSVAAALALDVLKEFGHLRLRAWGSSMLPAVWPGDVLSIERCHPDHIRCGDIVLLRREERVIVHRVRRLEKRASGRWVVTQGDSVPHPDPPVPGSEVLGRVTAIARGARGVRRTRWERRPRLASLLFRHEWSSRWAHRVHAIRRRMEA